MVPCKGSWKLEESQETWGSPGAVGARVRETQPERGYGCRGILSDNGSLGAVEHCLRKIAYSTLQKLPLRSKLPIFIRNRPNHNETTGTAPPWVAVSCKQIPFLIPPVLNDKAEPMRVPKSEGKGEGTDSGKVQCSFQSYFLGVALSTLAPSETRWKGRNECFGAWSGRKV